MKNLCHPNIQKLKFITKSSNNVRLVCELFTGNLVSYKEERKLIPEKEVLEIIRKIAFALAFLEKKSIVHRNLTPESICMLHD